jgi:hypothetical protein
VRNLIALAAIALALLAGCATSSVGPRGWQPMPGASGAWSTGTGSSASEYVYGKTPYSGNLQDLASRTTIDALMQHPGAKFRGSVPFAPCPGAAGVATFALGNGTTLQEGFSARRASAVRIRYTRPAGTAVDPAVTEAMQNALCAL